MGKRLHKLFKTLVKDISQDLQPLGDSGSDVPHFIPEPRNFSEVTKLSDEIKTLANGNSEGDEEYNQRSDFSS